MLYIYQIVELLKRVVVSRVVENPRHQWGALLAFWLLLGVAIGAGLWYDRHITLSSERQHLKDLSRVVKDNMERQLSAVHAAMLSLQEDIERFDGLVDHPDVSSKRLSGLVGALPGVRTISVFDATGTQLAGSRVEFVGQYFADRPYFQEALTLDSPETFLISTPFKTVLGVYTMAAMKIVVDNDSGQIHRVLAAFLEPSFFETLLSSVLYSDDMYAGIAHEDGVLVVVQPHIDQLIGIDLAKDDEDFVQFRQGNVDFALYEGYGQQRGGSALKALQRISLPSKEMPKHLILGLTRSTDAVLAPWRARTSIVIFSWLALGALAAFSLRLAQRYSEDIARLKAEKDAIREEAEEEIRQLAFYDPLTRLPNRRLLLDRLPMCQASSLRRGRYSALFFIDLDNFKTLNDTLGHAQGDELLIQVARRLQSCVREEDTVARIGGDEFVLMLPELGSSAQVARSAAEVVANKVLTALSEEYELLNEQRFRCSGSVGITLFGYRTETLDDVMERADDAMYAAKGSGRNAYRFADNDPPSAP